jgi:hypothetical protein
MRHIVRARLDVICAAAGRDLADLDLQVITAPSLGRDLDADRARLEHTGARLNPRLLVLDPFVRLLSAPARRCSVHPSSTPGATPTSVSAAIRTTVLC